MYTLENYAQKAAALWQRFTPNERALVGIGVFPADTMNKAEKDGYESQPLAVALMNRHSALPERTGGIEQWHDHRLIKP